METVNLITDTQNVDPFDSLEILGMNEMAEINGGMTLEQWLCNIGTGAAGSVVGWGISFVSGGAGALVGFGLELLGAWMCATYAD